MLGVDEEFRARLEAALARLPPYRVNGRGLPPGNGSRTGSSGRCQGHNVSPDFPFYPGSSITLPAAIRQLGASDRQSWWMETRRPPRRLADGLGSRDVGTTRAGRSGCRPACGRSSGIQARARPCAQRGLESSRTATSATRRPWPRPACSRVMRARSACVPRLPAGWTDGSITGLRALAAGLESAMQWKAGKLAASAQALRGIASGPCLVRSRRGRPSRSRYRQDGP